MPTMNNYFNFLFVNLGFIAMIAVILYYQTSLKIKKNWPLYRCNPTYWLFSDNITEDFTYCVQNTQMNMMGYLLQPINYMIASLTSIGGGFNKSMNDSRTMLSTMRNFISEIIQNIFSVFLNLVIEFQKMIIGIKDMVAKMIGIVVAVLYILDGSIKSMNSAWSGPPGKMVRAIGSCFHPDTLIKSKTGEIYKMKDIPLGTELETGGKVFAVLKIDNIDKVPLYQINNGVDNNPIFVTGEHFIFEKVKDTINMNDYPNWTKVKDYNGATLCKDNICDWFSCLITTDRHIKIGEQLFWDWEDDILNFYFS